MKQFFTFLLLALICIGCKKNNPSSETIIEPQDYSVLTTEAESLITKDELKTLQVPVEIPVPKIPVPKAVQEIIDNYTTSVKKLNRTLVIQIEGNFTGSGNREIIGFYEEVTGSIFGETWYSIIEAFCFVLDSNGESVDNVYAIDYLTWGFASDSRIPESGMGLSEDLGKPIVWRDQVIGCFGDFNKNEKDELYLFRDSALWIGPYFFEFDGNEFKKILDYSYVDATTILGVDSEKKIIFLKDHVYPEGQDYQKFEQIITYIWDETTQMYEQSSYSELKFFRWNRNLQQYEEVKR